MEKATHKNREILFYGRRRKYGFLSNMYLCPIKIDGVTYKSVEHYYQSRKAKKSEIRVWIASAPLAFFAFSSGRSLREKDMVKNWEGRKLKVMRKALYAKFTQNKELRKKLIKTADAVLHENSPTDLFWGMRGKDYLGKELMCLRERLMREGF
ncbi:MAG: NADAR family protein [Candidatus Parvarchaeota archaeon]|jgi:ribA/ribD-fused uncharacterized protein|nr:NADAR family protein [Candidatus Parvarchaeota archaeon]